MAGRASTPAVKYKKYWTAFFLEDHKEKEDDGISQIRGGGGSEANLLRTILTTGFFKGYE